MTQFPHVNPLSDLILRLQDEAGRGLQAPSSQEHRMNVDSTTEAVASAAKPPEAVRGLPLIAYEAYQQSRAHVFPSVESLRWFERQHRAELVARGALCMPAGRKLVLAEKFDAVVLEVGARLVAARGGRP